MDLFDYMVEKNMEKESPLAMRMRPLNIEEVVGQEHIVGEGKLLRRMIEADKLSSVIFYGPPGTGKTSLARVIANSTKAEFRQINATTAGKKDMEAVVAEAKENLAGYNKKTILFIDEIHRFNKSQQDYLLPFVEDGTVTLIGATTENPYFEVNSALLSRSTIFELHPLTKSEVKSLLERTLKDETRGLGTYGVEISDDALEFLADVAGGDARSALNALELAVLTTRRSEDGAIHVNLDVAEECIQKRAIHYDKDGDQHYDTISAFIKSMRGSDPDAAVFYLAKMLKAGEDIKFIARRMMICASEDVGNADPMALVLATSAAQAVERIGLPESHLILAQAAIYIAGAPKSNACTNAIYSAEDVVDKVRTSVPGHLMNVHANGYGDEEKAIGYKYAHNYPEHYVKQQYLPDEITDEVFYEPTDIGKEKDIKDRLERLKNRTE